MSLDIFVQSLCDAVPRDDNRAVGLMELLLRESLQRNASDLHLECKRDCLLVKMRLDGRLHVAAHLEPAMRSALLTRLKVMAKLVIYQSLKPQDGRLDLEQDGQVLTCRVAFLPTLHGEKAVIRLPERRQAQMELADLGMGAALREQVQAQLRCNQGAILLTGPSSSGKTTTIYAMLKALFALRGEAANIVTLEDPVEADLGMISQTQVRAEQGLGFDEGLRSLLRQDPDVIMVGEMRDAQTARIAVQAALTGHLLISTLHCGWASGVFVRLLNMGVEPFLITSAINAVLAQRLVRRLCTRCRKQRRVDEKNSLRLSGIFEGLERWWAADGCEECEQIGYRGRSALFEMVLMNESLAALVMERAPQSRFRQTLEDEDDLADDARRKVEQGLTSPEEALACLE